MCGPQPQVLKEMRVWLSGNTLRLAYSCAHVYLRGVLEMLDCQPCRP